MSLKVKPPEKKRKTKNPSPPPSLPSSTPSFSLLPDEITLNYLARIPRSYYTTVSIVSKSFHSLLSSTELNAERSRLGITEHCLYVCLSDYSYQCPQWFTLSVNPNQTLPNSSVTKKKKKKKKKTNGQLLVPIGQLLVQKKTIGRYPMYLPSDYLSLSKFTVVVGSEIYVIGGPVDGAPSSTVRILDCRSHTWRDAPKMNVRREFAATCFYDGKIYVIGGYKGLNDNESWGEVFDIKTQTWERLPNPGNDVCKYNIFRIVEIEGKIYVEDRENEWNIYAYDTKQDKWELSENESVTKSECVIENVSYSCRHDGQLKCWWYDINAQIWREVKGLNFLQDQYITNGNSSDIGRSELVSFGGKLLLIWEGYKKRRKKIRCAEIKLEKRDGGEIWGNVEWVDIVHSVSDSRKLLHCLAVSV